jgi:hypothetical protein
LEDPFVDLGLAAAKAFWHHLLLPHTTMLHVWAKTYGILATDGHGEQRLI